MKKENIKDALLTGFHGFSMGVANSVPGVSGGTIAFILGIYDKFIDSLHNLVNKDKEVRKEAWIYAIKLGIGLAIGLLLCVVVLAKLFESEVYILCSAFMGLTLAAIPFVVISEKETLKGKYYNVLWAIFGIALVVGLSMLRDRGIINMNVDFIGGLTPFQYFYVFIVGALAISAMVLPGISGSTIMLILGVYLPVLAAVKEVLKFKWTGHLIFGVAAFGIGIIVGIVAAIKIIKVALEKCRNAVVWLILGLMAGSLYAIMMGPTTMKVADGETAKAAMTLALGKPNSISIIAFIVGALLLVGLELVKKASEKKNND